MKDDEIIRKKIAKLLRRNQTPYVSFAKKSIMRRMKLHEERLKLLNDTLQEHEKSGWVDLEYLYGNSFPSMVTISDEAPEDWRDFWKSFFSEILRQHKDRHSRTGNDDS